jgi:hypothetical protein
MVASPSFRLYNVTKDEWYEGDDILDDREYGGVHWSHAAIGRRAPWSLVLNNLDGRLLDNGGNNGLTIENRDEIQLLVSSPGENVTDALVVHGVVTDAVRRITQHNDRTVRISGMDFFSFWDESREFERDYKANPLAASDVLIDAISAIHPNFAVEPRVPRISTQVYKHWVACAPVDCIIETCAAFNQDVYVRPDDVTEVFAVNSRSSGRTINATHLISGGELRHTSNGTHYDRIRFLTNNPYYVPNNATPTSGSFNNPVHWRLRDPDNTSAVYFDPLFKDTSYHAYNEDVDRQHNGVIIGPLLAGFQSIALRHINHTITRLEAILAGPHVPGVLNSRIGILERNFETLNFFMQNNFSSTSFRIVLREVGRRSGTNEWMSKELHQAGNRGAHMGAVVRLPSMPHVEPGFWTATGNPQYIDQVSFIWRGGTNYNTATLISHIFFQGMVRANAVVASPPAYERELVITDRTISDPTDAQNIADAELSRVKDPAIVGSLNVEGSIFYRFPGYRYNLHFPSDGISNKLTRLESAAHHVVGGEWTADLEFAPLLVKGGLYNRLAEISLRNSENLGQDLTDQQIEAMINNLVSGS